MSYAAASNVADYTPGLLDDGNFTSTTMPSKAAVESFLSSGCAIIESKLQARGYSIPVPGNSVIYTRVKQLETWYGAAEAESVRMTARVAVTERTRAQFFATKFEKGLDKLLDEDLSRAGLSHTSKAYAGGISRSDKDAVEADTDRVAPRFERDQFRHEGAESPRGKDIDQESE